MNSRQNAPIPAKLTPNLGLKDRNTFGLDAVADFAYEITAAEQVPGVIEDITEKNLAWRVLGGGSNVILPAVLPGATLLINISGQEIASSDQTHTLVEVGAGVNWHEFVAWTLENNLPIVY